MELPPSTIMAGRVEASALANETIWLASRPVSSAAHAGVKAERASTIRQFRQCELQQTLGH
jgi:hypothetical protein